MVRRRRAHSLDVARMITEALTLAEKLWALTRPMRSQLDGKLYSVLSKKQANQIFMKEFDIAIFPYRRNRRRAKT
jgi:hypothetical protein